MVPKDKADLSFPEVRFIQVTRLRPIHATRKLDKGEATHTEAVQLPREVISREVCPFLQPLMSD